MGLASIDSALRRGLGAIKVIGSTYAVYRIGGKSGEQNGAVSVIDPLNLVNSALPARIVKNTNKLYLEQADIYKMSYTGILDSRSLKIGDVLVMNGPTTTDSPDGRIFTYADEQPLLPSVFMRTEITGSFSRPNGAERVQAPLQGAIPYQGTNKPNEWVYILNDGLFEIAPSGIPAVIPLGLQPYERIGPASIFKYPTVTRRGTYFAYVMNLNGVQIQAGDVIQDQNGNRFKTQNVYSSTTGLQGYFMICESLYI